MSPQAVSAFYEVVATVRVASLGQAAILGLKLAGVAAGPPEAEEASQRGLGIVLGLGTQVAFFVPLAALYEAIWVLDLGSRPAV